MSTTTAKGHAARRKANAARERLASALRHLLYKRWVRNTLYRLRHVSLPGNKGVPLYDVLSCFLASIFNGQLWQRAKGLSFSFLTALPPMLLFLFTLIAYFPVDGLQNELLAQFKDIVPEKVFEPIANTVNDVMGHRHTSLLSIGFVGSIVLAANGMNGIMTSFNFANRTIEKRPWLTRYLISIVLVFVLFVMVVAELVLLMGYKYMVLWLLQAGVVPHTRLALTVLGIVRWALMTFMILLVLSIIYYMAPVKKQRVGFFSSGAVLATVILMGLNGALQIYFNNFNRYNLLYGSIGTLLVIMMWVAFNCMVLLVGYELNTSILNGTLRNKQVRKPKLFNNNDSSETKR
ncbi:MAG: YihY/virulence factor BrkB family protein [Bacteroidales bacterium]|nr:YihY/virulence factor BrkB family protein [Bacteroidales bacterium]